LSSAIFACPRPPELPSLRSSRKISDPSNSPLMSSRLSLHLPPISLPSPLFTSTLFVTSLSPGLPLLGYPSPPDLPPPLVFCLRTSLLNFSFKSSFLLAEPNFSLSNCQWTRLSCRMTGDSCPFNPLLRLTHLSFLLLSAHKVAGDCIFLSVHLTSNRSLPKSLCFFSLYRSSGLAAHSTFPTSGPVPFVVALRSFFFLYILIAAIPHCIALVPFPSFAPSLEVFQSTSYEDSQVSLSSAPSPYFTGLSQIFIRSMLSAPSSRLSCGAIPPPPPCPVFLNDS